MSKILIDEGTMKLALDAMQRIEDADMDCDFLYIRQAIQLEEAITALRKAWAAQPSPEIAIADAYRAGVVSGIAAEREACARVAEDSDHVVKGKGYYDQLGNADATVKNIAAAIRARSNT